MHADLFMRIARAAFSPFSVASSSSAQLVPLLVDFRLASGLRNSVRCCVFPLRPPAQSFTADLRGAGRLSEAS